MADYRFSAKVIKRSNGQSAVASSAYRSATRLCDERTGQTCDYTRKAGVIHSEVMAPEATPDWMHDRAQLWNAVEAVERRKDAQLAREIQLSLPHELTDDQRRDLVRGFVQEQFVGKGMIADLAIHAPSTEGDQRNHHAHVMLTMRELAGDGFGKKAREWNSTDQLALWREQWAHHQNRTLERHGHPARVDHRSFEAQGVDREPTQHLGPVASDMERNGKSSRIGDENRQAHANNIERIADHMERAEVMSAIDHQKARLAEWADRKRAELDNARDLSELDLSQKHDRQSAQLEQQLADRHGTLRATVKAELQATERRLEAKGFRKILRTVFGQTRTDQQAQKDLTSTLANIETRENEERQALAKRQEAERAREKLRTIQHKERLEKGIEKATERREREGWKPTRPKTTKQPERTTEAKQAPSPAPKSETRREAPTQPIKGRFGQEAQPPENKPMDAPDLATEKTTRGHVLDEFKGDAKRPWESAVKSQDNKRPWESGLTRGEGMSRERSPSNGGPKSSKS